MAVNILTILSGAYLFLITIWVRKTEFGDAEIDTIHVVLSLRGAEPIQLAEVMLKSMLYFQGRLKVDDGDCSTAHFPQRFPRCPETLPTRSNPIMLHILIDPTSRGDFAQVFNVWQKPYLKWVFYRAEYHEQLLRELRNSHHSGIPSMMKLLVPVILPDEISKVIVMDTDMLFNHNVLDLWNLFYEFNESQAIGLAWTLKAPLPQCQYFRYEPITDRGLNGGLSLMYLSKLREIDWHSKWQEASRKFFERNHILRQADQDIFNTVIELNPTIYFRIPCEWNLQLCAKTGPDCCPVVWPIKTPNEMDCVSRPLDKTTDNNVVFRPNMARLVHFTGKDKNEYLNATTAENITLDIIDRRLTQVELKTRFGEVFRAFKALPSKCF